MNDDKMTVGQLRQALLGYDDDAAVYISVGPEGQGRLLTNVEVFHADRDAGVNARRRPVLAWAYDDSPASTCDWLPDECPECCSESLSVAPEGSGGWRCLDCGETGAMFPGFDAGAVDAESVFGVKRELGIGSGLVCDTDRCLATADLLKYDDGDGYTRWLCEKCMSG